MSENENPAEIAPPNTIKTSRLANIPLKCVLFSILLFAASILIGYSDISIGYCFEVISVFSSAFFLLAMGLLYFAIASGLAISVFVLVTHKQRKGALRAVTGALLSILALGLIFPQLGRSRPLTYRLICATHLSQLGKAIHVYARDHNDMLLSQQWCDSLVKDANVTPGTFVCKASDTKRRQSSYAFNKNLIGRKLSEINPNTVVIFETAPGWNQVGGIEILSMRNHDGDGCNILYGDLHVSFETAQNISNLRWEP